MQSRTVATVCAAAMLTVGLTTVTHGSVAAAELAAGSDMCGSIPATIVGKDGPDRIRGTNGADVIQANGGDDQVLGVGGDDRICLGPGQRDIAKGGAGNDEFIAEAALDGRDEFYGDGGSDAVRYVLRSTGISVTIDGVANDGQAGEQDNVHTNVENVQGTDADDTLVGSDGDNVFIAIDGEDTLRGGPGNDELLGVDDNDRLTGNAGDDELYAGDGNDTIIADAQPDGADLVFGGRDEDNMTYAARGAGFRVHVTLDNLANDGTPGESDNIDTATEGVIGGSGDDILIATAPTADTDNYLAGRSGNDVLLSEDGAFDVVDGGPNSDHCWIDGVDLRFNCEVVD